MNRVEYVPIAFPEPITCGLGTLITTYDGFDGTLLFSILVFPATWQCYDETENRRFLSMLGQMLDNPKVWRMPPPSNHVVMAPMRAFARGWVDTYRRSQRGEPRLPVEIPGRASLRRIRITGNARIPTRAEFEEALDEIHRLGCPAQEQANVV